VPGSGDDGNPAAGSYVRLAVTTPPAGVDPVNAHDYCYPSIDSVIHGPVESICRIEPQPPPLPTKSRGGGGGRRGVGWWDCHRRRQRARAASQLRATWAPSPRLTTYGAAEQTGVVTSRVSLSNSQSSSLNTRRPAPPWRARLVCFVRTVFHPCRWRRRCWQRRRLVGGGPRGGAGGGGSGCSHVSAT